MTWQPPKQKSLDEEFDELVARFKPQFNNPDHLEIAKCLKDIGRLQKNKQGKACIEKIINRKRQVVYLLKKEQQNNGNQ